MKYIIVVDNTAYGFFESGEAALNWILETKPSMLCDNPVFILFEDKNTVTPWYEVNNG